MPNAIASAQLPVLPDPCSQVDIAKYGWPVMFLGRNGEAFGASIPRDHVRKDEEVRIDIWLSTESATTREMLACCESLFLARIQVFDASGNRLKSGYETFDRKTANREANLSIPALAPRWSRFRLAFAALLIVEISTAPILRMLCFPASTQLKNGRRRRASILHDHYYEHKYLSGS